MKQTNNTNQFFQKTILLIALLFFSTLIKSQCAANFSMSTGPNGLVTFTSTSTGTLSWTQYSWTYGDGGTGSGITSAHTYTSNGWKKICLTINNFSPACTSTKCDSIKVTNASSSSACQAAFTPSGCVNGQVTFINTSTGTGNFTYYNWTFGDGGFGWAKNPVHTYTANGIYNVCLTIKDSTSGCNSTKCMTVNVNCVTSSSVCQAAFTPSGCVNGLVQFYSTSTGVGNFTTYKYTFGDGGQAFTKNASHTYTANGVYNVCLTIKDSTSGCNSTKCQTVNVNCVTSSSVCQAAFTASGCVNGTVQFYSTSTGVGNFTTYKYTFGDGGLAFTKNASHTYTANGVYNVCLTIQDSTSGCYSIKCQTVNVNCITSGSCLASFTSYSCVGGTTWFYSTSTGTTATTKYSWSFGDGGTSLLKNPSHTYTANGVYNVCLNMIDSINNCQSSKCQTVSINCVSTSTNCSANFTYSNCVNGVIQYFNTSSGTSGTTTYNWTFGDGGTGSGTNPIHTYTANGTYNVCLTINDSINNCNSTYCKPVVINCVASGIKTISSGTGSIKIYPNPNNGAFKLDLNDADLNAKYIDIVIFNVLGEKVYVSHEEVINGNLSKDIDVTDLANGSYYLRLSTANNVYTVKTIINR